MTGGRALLCCPREDRDVTSRLSSQSLPAASARALITECPSDSRTPSGTPGPLDTVPWRWGSSGVGWVPSFPLPRPQEGGRGGEGGRPSGGLQRRASGLSRW